MDQQLGKARSSKGWGHAVFPDVLPAPLLLPADPAGREHLGLCFWCLERHQRPSPFIPSHSCPGEGFKNFLKTLLHTAGQDLQCQGQQEKNEPFQLPEPGRPRGLVFEGPPFPNWQPPRWRAHAGPWTPACLHPPPPGPAAIPIHGHSTLSPGVLTLKDVF